MALLGPPSRGNDPLHVFAMAAALVAAAVVGAGIGFLLDSGEEEEGQTAPEANGQDKGQEGSAADAAQGAAGATAHAVTGRGS